MASSDLLWECVKNNSSFIRTSPNMPKMSAEPGNLCGKNSYKFSGLASAKVLNVSSKVAGKKEMIVLTTRHSKGSRSVRPKSMLLAKGLKKATKKGVEGLGKVMGAGFYRPDLLDLATAKYNKLKTSFKKKALVVKSRRATKSA
mmetsp:Transcript_29751/g.65010  ORF Transcript_29751/g.65010 Transcript_29751/m.65010 type:complete len:144 (+) Transcript_29751:64-495(+)